MLTQPTSRKSKQKKTLLLLGLLVCLAFLAGRLGKQYYLRHSEWFDTSVSSFFSKTQPDSLKPPLPTTQAHFGDSFVLFLLDASEASMEVLHGATRQSHFLKAIQAFTQNNPDLPFKVISYATPEAPSLKIVFQKLSETTPFPKHLLLLCSGLPLEGEELPFEIIALTEKFPSMTFSVIKSGSRNREEDARLFQIANEGGGGLYWANEEKEMVQTLHYWLQTEIFPKVTKK